MYLQSKRIDTTVLIMAKKEYKNYLSMDSISYTPKDKRKENELKGYLVLLDSRELIFVRGETVESVCDIIEEKYPNNKYFLNAYVSFDCSHINEIKVL